ncbi:MAG: hypothetical protein A2Y12_07865 [Planctomycetes bacterium GWF2_42_9]|nr:MAG: hypothetical protein A2Y12_07865 [Planctomycetes bacterium GWF2_42_9]
MRRANHLDENLKKLLGKTEPIQALSADEKREIVGNLLRNANMETAQVNAYVLRNRFSAIINFKSATVATAIIILLLLCLLNKPKENIFKQIESTQVKQQNAVQPQAKQIEASQKITFDIDKLAAAGDVNGLIAALSDNVGQETKIAAANFLAKLGNATAIDALKKEEVKWTGAAAENPFTKAIAEIENKLKENKFNANTKPADTNNISGVKAITDPNDPNGWPYMEVYVTDKQTDEPIAGVRVKGSESKKKSTTDANGYCKVTLGKKTPDYFSVYVEKEGFVPMFFNWGKECQRSIPKEFEFILEKGTVIGGTVVNEENQSVQNAKIKVNYHINQDDPGVPYQNIRDYIIKTDVNGKWQCDILPARLAEFGNINLEITHEKYATLELWSNQTEALLQKMQSQELVSVMKKGLVIYGYVTDSENRPIKKATVLAGELRSRTNITLKTETDDSGYYEFSNTPKGHNVVLVKAKGFTPDVKELNSRQDSIQQNFTLLVGNTIHGRVVDVNGNPISNVRLYADEWRNSSIDWTGKTDKDGRFVWNEAPADEVRISFYANNNNCMGKELTLTPSAEEYKIVLPPPLVIFGCVKNDANEIISQGKITVGAIWQCGESLCWQRGSDWSKNFTDGKFEIPLRSAACQYALRLDLPDGRQIVSRNFDTNEGRVRYDFVVSTAEKSNLLTGMVYDPNGNPAQGVKIFTVKQGRGLQLQNGKQQYRDDAEKFITDSQGKFSMPAYNEKFKLVAISENAYADVNSYEFMSEPNIYLAKWGRIEGIAYIGSKPAEGQQIFAQIERQYFSSNDIFYHYLNTAIVDSSGKFVMEKVVSGKNSVSRILQSDDLQQITSTAYQTVEVVSGQTAKVVIGGTGRTIVGKIIWPNDELFTKSLWIGADLQPQQPELTKQTTRQQRGGIIVNTDGSFRGEDIEEGSYTLNINVYERQGRYGGMNTENQIIGKIDFTVPPIDSSNIDVPLDLGQLALEIISSKKALPADSNAPDFSVETSQKI